MGGAARDLASLEGFQGPPRGCGGLKGLVLSAGGALKMVPFRGWADQGPQRIPTLGGGLWYGKVSPGSAEITEDQQRGRESQRLPGGHSGWEPRPHTAGLLRGAEGSRSLQNQIRDDQKNNSHLCLVLLMSQACPSAL